MARRSAAGLLWIWGLWAAGSTLDFLTLAPTWPFLLAGVAIAAWIMAAPHQGTNPTQAPAATPRA